MLNVKFYFFAKNMSMNILIGILMLTMLIGLYLKIVESNQMELYDLLVLKVLIYNV